MIRFLDSVLYNPYFIPPNPPLEGGKRKEKKSRLGGEKRNPTPITKARKDGDDQVLRFGFIQSLLYPP